MILAADARLVAPGHQRGARDGADGRGDKRARKPRALRRQRIHVWRANRHLAVARKMWRHVVHENPEDVRFYGSGGVATKRAIDLPAPIGSIVATTDPDVLLVSHRAGLSTLRIDDLVLQPHANPEQNRDGVISNDLKVDRWGRLWLATSHEKEQLPRGALWCVENSTRWTLADVGFAIGNGPAFSPDGKVLYFSDSFNRQILAYDISKDNSLVVGRRVLAQFTVEEGMPDGLTVDASGNIWSAQWAGASIFKLSPAGEKLQHIAVPSGHVTSVAFNHNRLLITTARDGLSDETLRRYPLSGSVFELATDEVGLAEPLFQL